MPGVYVNGFYWKQSKFVYVCGHLFVSGDTKDLAMVFVYLNKS